MPSARYHREQAKTLLSWARATKDKPYADRLRARAAEELEQADAAREAVADLNLLLTDFNSQQLPKDRTGERAQPMRDLEDLLALVGSPDEIAPVDTAHFARNVVEVITGACNRKALANVSANTRLT